MDLHPTRVRGIDLNIYIKHTFIRDIMRHLSVRYIDGGPGVERIRQKEDMPDITKTQVMLMNYACKAYIYLEMAKLDRELKNQEPGSDINVSTSDVLGLREEVRVLYRII